MSANITPRSNATAALNPFVILVSNKTQKTGPIINAVKNPTVIGVNMLKSTIRCKYNSQLLLKKYSQLFCLFFHVRLSPRPACCLLQVL